MTTPPVIIAFGVPRSGTTFVQRWIYALKPSVAHTIKLQEGCYLHPKNSDDGLKHLRHFYANRKVLFIWIQRNPIGVFQSLYAAKKTQAERLKEVIPADMKGVSGIAKKDAPDYFEYIDRTFKNAQKQIGKPCVADGPTVDVLKVEFEKLGRKRYQKQICNAIAQKLSLPHHAEKTLFNFLKNNYNINPVRSGALSYGIRNQVELPPELVEKIIEKYG